MPPNITNGIDSTLLESIQYLLESQRPQMMAVFSVFTRVVIIVCSEVSKKHVFGANGLVCVLLLRRKRNRSP
jgi:hypothetical protein